MRIAALLLLLFACPVMAQEQRAPNMDYGVPQKYEIGGITVSGTQSVDANAVKLFAGLQVGEQIEIPGDRIARAIRNLWDQKLFSDVRIESAEIRGRVIFLHIIVVEKPLLSRWKYSGVSRNESEKLDEIIGLTPRQQVNEALMTRARVAIRAHYVEKGYLNADVRFREYKDTLQTALVNSVVLLIDVEQGARVRIRDVVFHGNTALSDAKLRRALKKTRRKRWYNLFGSSKFIPKEFAADKAHLREVYNNEGFRNVEITGDTMYKVGPKRVRVEVTVDEGQRFYFRNITWTGNTKYRTSRLDSILNIHRGDVYSKKTLDSRLYMNPAGRDISSLYMDDGYLSFYPEPVEIMAEGDSIDLEIRIREGRQFRIRNVIIKGNTKTNEHVVRREIRSKPGQLFNRSDVIRTQRELSQLGYFDPEKMGVEPVPDQRTGLVDLVYTVEEKPSDKLELSGGWGAGRLVMSLGLSFTNFSLRKIGDPKAYQPLPAGDGQTLNLRAQTNGRFFQSYSLSFVEPWLGGRKPNSLSFSLYHSVQSNGEPRFVNTADGRIRNPDRQSLLISGATLGLGKRLQWPDDWFILRQTLSYQLYDLRNYSSGQVIFSFSNGTSNVLAYQISLSRNSIDQPFFARTGSEVSLSMKATPPYSLFNPGKDYATLEADQRYKLAEFHKWKFTTQWFNKLTNSKTGHNLVLMTRAGWGFLGRYSNAIGDSPFERFYLGGAALTGFQLDGREIVGLRGYDDFSLSPQTGNFIVSKYTAELRFPVSLNPQATIYTLAFAQAGNTWGNFDTFDPFKLYRSAGVGLRLFLPMFGPMGLDYGWRLDDVPTAPNMAKSQFHFTIGIDLGEL
ncbi:MAG: outer membrane protein assembly factor BamA [Flavobacteriales bacterium]|nr:outer membrane protein assembly factor BamA [Flavobacteriales bacterium]